MGMFKKSLEFKPHKTIQITALPSSEFDKLPYKNIQGDLGFAVPKESKAFIRITPDYEENKDTLHHEIGELLNATSADEDEFGIRHKSIFSKMGDWVEKTFVPEKVKETVADIPILNDIISRGWLGPITQRFTEEGKEASDKGTGTAGWVNKATMAALGLVPGVGPLLATGYGLGQAPDQELMSLIMGALEGYGLGGLGAGVGGMVKGAMLPTTGALFGAPPGMAGSSMFQNALSGFGQGSGSYFNAPGLGGLWGAGGKATDLVSNLLGGFGGGSNLVNASYKNPITGQMVNQMFNPATRTFTVGTGGGSNWFQNILGSLTGGGGGGQGGANPLSGILQQLGLGGTTGTSGLGSTGLQALLSMLLGGQGTSFPSAPNYQSATDAMNEALGLIKQEFPLSYGARENALAQLNQIFANPSAFYSQYQPTSLEQATASNLYATNLEQAKRTAGQRASMAGIETIFPELFAKAISPTITGIGEYLGGLGQTRATQGLQTLLAQIGIDPTALSGLTNLSAAQSNLQTGAGYQNQLMEYFKKMEESQAKTSSLSTILGDILGGGGGLISPTTGTSGGSDILQTILNSVLGGGQGGGGLLGGIGNIFGNILGNIGKAIPVF